MNQLLVSILRSRNKKNINAIMNAEDIKNKNSYFNPLILHRSVDPKLINSLYKIKSIDLKQTTLAISLYFVQ